jgi:hypothetical protein
MSEGQKGRHDMPVTENGNSVFTRIVVERLLRPVWNTLVAYGSLWLPAGPYAYQFQHPYPHDGTVAAYPAGGTSVPGGSDAVQSGRETLSAS